MTVAHWSGCVFPWVWTESPEGDYCALCGVRRASRFEPLGQQVARRSLLLPKEPDDAARRRRMYGYYLARRRARV